MILDKRIRGGARLKAGLTDAAFGRAAPGSARQAAITVLTIDPARYRRRKRLAVESRTAAHEGV